MKATWELTGFEEYIAKLEGATDGINQVSREALAEAGKILQVAIQARCPSDKLKPFIKIFTPSGKGDYNYVAVGYVRDLAYTPKEIAVAANSVEFGSVHNAPMPHVRPAVSALRAAVKNLIVNRLKAAGYLD